MGNLIFAINLTLDGCYDHREGVGDEELLLHFARLNDSVDAMLFGRINYEMMESAWPAVARDEKAPPAAREWAQNLDRKPKYVVSRTRRDFPWSNSQLVTGELREAVIGLKKETPKGLLLSGPTLAQSLEQMGLIDEYHFVVHPVLAGHGPTLFQGLEPSRRLDLLSATPFKSGVVAMRYRRRGG